MSTFSMALLQVVPEEDCNPVAYMGSAGSQGVVLNPMPAKTVTFFEPMLVKNIILLSADAVLQMLYAGITLDCSSYCSHNFLQRQSNLTQCQWALLT